MTPEQMRALATAYRLVVALMQLDHIAFNAAVTDGPEDSTGVCFALCGLVLDLAHRDAFEDGQLLEYLRTDLLALAAAKDG